MVLGYLSDLELFDQLPLIFDGVLIPTRVFKELGRAPRKLKAQVKNVLSTQGDFYRRCTEVDEVIISFYEDSVDAGEAEAVAQAGDHSAAVLSDDRAAYVLATGMGLEVVRTGRLLLHLKEAGAIAEVRPVLDSLRKLGGRLGDEPYAALVAEAGE